MKADLILFYEKIMDCYQIEPVNFILNYFGRVNWKKIILHNLVLCLIFLSPILAQSQPDYSPSLKVPNLGEHKFMPNNIVRHPFLQTSVRNTLGIGKAYDIEIPLIVIGGDPLIALRGDLIFLNLDFEYQHRVKDWLGVWARFLVLTRLGNGTEALLSQGITAVSGFDLGWLFKLRQTEKTQLSGSLSLSNKNTTIVDLLDFINGIIDGDFTTTNQLVKTVPSLQGNLGLRYAWAINEMYGTYLLTELAYGQSVVERNEGKFFYRIGGAFDIDLSVRTIFPFGLALGFTHASLPRTGDATKSETQSIFLQIGYNTPHDFIIGLKISMEFLPVEYSGKTLKAGLTTINMRYYFN